MLRLEGCKALFIVAGLIGTLICAFPSLALIVHMPSQERFSELWVLGPNHMAENYPFNVKANETYNVYIGVGNHMASSCYYLVYVKFRNQTEALPNSTAGTPSPLSPLYKYHAMIQDGKTWEMPLTFSFSHASHFENQCLIAALTINKVTFSVDKPASWDVNNTGYYYQLFMELWTYNVKVEEFQFHNRFVYLWLNITF